jgi:RNA polymerase sigma-70 factor (ECF subfamily)
LPRSFERTAPRQANDGPAVTPTAEARLVIAAREGDRSAFADLYRQYVRMVHGVLLARLPRAEVDDLVQDVFLTAMYRIGSLREAAAFPGWLASIARNRAIDFLRRRRVETLELVTEPAAPDGDTSEAVAVLAEIGALPDAYRETLVLRLVEGLTGPEIASKTGLTPASVRVNLHRGMKMLRARLEKETPR